MQLQGQAVSRLTKALLEANDRIYKFNTTSVSPAETPAASEQLCGPARPLQVRTQHIVNCKVFQLLRPELLHVLLFTCRRLKSRNSKKKSNI